MNTVSAQTPPGQCSIAPPGARVAWAPSQWSRYSQARAYRGSPVSASSRTHAAWLVYATTPRPLLQTNGARCYLGSQETRTRCWVILTDSTSRASPIVTWTIL